MKIKLLMIPVLLCLTTGIIKSQSYDIVIKGGHIIDPKNSIDAVMDIAINEGKIAMVANNINQTEGKKVIDARDMYVTPGLIDMHVHVFYGTNAGQDYMNGPNGVAPDGFTFRAGVTTVVDAGSSGWRTFPVFKKQTIDMSKTRVLAFLNIVGEGMRGGPFEQNVKDMNAQRTAEFATNNPNEIVGIKLAHYEGYEWAPNDSAARAGRLANLPAMVDFGGANPPLSIEDLFMKHLRSGDIFAHCYASLTSRESVVDENGKVKPFVFEARKKGIIFEVGHGGGSFRWSQAIPAIEQGFLPDVISSDLHIGSMNGGMKDMANLMSKFLNMGLSVQDVILRSTWNPAKVINRPELGNLSVGTEADVAVFSLRKGNFGFIDVGADKIVGTQKLEAELTIRAGKIVWDLNGLAANVYKH
ncbi:MAG TPA: amidohydrolase/deacetylase family metallohydrolase [Draconibacterium sp.]|nr:amidohydrolase/deacetylase family metallohydrolase [Draconibacterium sp.]